MAVIKTEFGEIIGIGKNEKLSVAVFHLVRGGRIKLHAHHITSEKLTVISGLAGIGPRPNRMEVLKKGDCEFFGPEQPHAIVNRGRFGLFVVSLCSPAFNSNDEYLPIRRR